MDTEHIPGYPDVSLKPQVKPAPYNSEVEKFLLGALLWNADRFHDVAETVEADAFYVPKHRYIFESMSAIANRGDAIDSVTVAAHLEQIEQLAAIGGHAYLTELVDQSPSTAHVESYAKIIRDAHVRRQLQQAGTAIAELSVSTEKEVEMLIDDSEKELFEITQHYTHARYREIGHVIPDLVHEIITVSENSNKHRGIPSGYETIDNALSGFHPSDLIILAARPSVGKTALALDIARRSASKHKTAIGIFSLEMSTSQLIERLLATESHLDAWRMRTGKMHNQQDFNALNEAAERLRSLPIYIDDRSAMSTLNIRSTARRMKREHNIKMLIVDYLQLVTPHETRRSESLVQHITEVSRTLKQVARELSIPVMALSQLSRDIEKRAGKPRLSDLRDSGSIEQDADVVMFLHRKIDQVYEGDEEGPIPTDLLIEKHRNGPTGRVALQFERKFASFIEPAPGNYGPDTVSENPPFLMYIVEYMEYGKSEFALAELFKKFPGIGQRQAQRFAAFISRSGNGYLQQLIDAMHTANQASVQCTECFIRHESDQVICTLCQQKNPDTLVVVEKDIDAHALISSSDESSTRHYFILGGLIPIANNNIEYVRLSQLLQTVEKKKPQEIVIAFSVHPDADHTIRFLANKIHSRFPDVSVTTLGRGLSNGLELEYSDPETLINAFKKRDSV